jgi:polyisoprenoid-binding protein YceI
MTPERAVSPERYRLEPRESRFTVHAFAEGLLSVFGHDPVIAVKELSGEFRFLPDTFESASLRITIDANGLKVVNDVNEKDRNEIERTMYEQVLETLKYPQIEFRSENVAVSRLGVNRYRARVIGDLSLHGVTQRSLWIMGEVFVNDDRLQVKGEVPLRQTDYKIKRVSVAGGTLKLKDELKCKFDLVAVGASLRGRPL